MKKANFILLAAASLAALASCGSKPSSSQSSAPVSSSSAMKTYTFENISFAVTADYSSGTTVSYPSASVINGPEAPDITALKDLIDVCTVAGYDSVRVGATLTVNGNFIFSEGTYVATEQGGTLSNEAPACVEYTYNKETNKFVPKEASESMAALNTLLGDATHYQYVIGAKGALSPISSLENGASVEISFPSDWLQTNAVTSYKFAAVYAA